MIVGWVVGFLFCFVFVVVKDVGGGGENDAAGEPRQTALMTPWVCRGAGQRVKGVLWFGGIGWLGWGARSRAHSMMLWTWDLALHPGCLVPRHTPDTWLVTL